MLEGAGLAQQQNASAKSRLAFWTLLASLCSLFVLLLMAVKYQIAQDFDRSFLLKLRNPVDLSDPLGPSWFEEFVRDMTSLGSTGVLTWMTLLFVVYAMRSNNKSWAVYIALNVSLATLCNHGLKLLIARPRPELVAHVSEVFTYSFPSGHAMLSAVVYLTFALFLVEIRQGKQRVFMMTSAVLTVMLVGLSRIYLGVHWPSDVLAGWLAAAIWLMLANRFRCHYLEG
jgi:undecaprenyl-diphosphatase